MVARLRSWALAVWHFVSNAPLTYAWLVVLVITTIIQNNLTGSQLHFVLLHRSTNIAELGRDPLEVLFSSLLWIDGRNLEPYLLLFTLFLAPAEHWLGHLRWLTVGLTAHIGATYLSEGLLYLAIQHRDASERMVHARDIGALIAMDKAELDFTAVGHFASILIGLLFYPMARERDGRLWNPARIKSLLHRRGTRGRRA